MPGMPGFLPGLPALAERVLCRGCNNYIVFQRETGGGKAAGLGRHTSEGSRALHGGNGS